MLRFDEKEYLCRQYSISIAQPNYINKGSFLLDPSNFLRSLTCVHPFDSELELDFVSPRTDYNQTGRRDSEATEEATIWQQQILVFPSVTPFNLRKCRNAVGNWQTSNGLPGSCIQQVNCRKIIGLHNHVVYYFKKDPRR